MYRKLMLLAFLIAAPILAVAPAGAQNWTQVGMLKCKLDPTVGLIIASKQRMICGFTTSNPSVPPQNYAGVMTTVGIDIGAIAGGELAWAVLAPTRGTPIGDLSGTYIGASGEATVIVGGGANLLIGGSNRSVALQPLSVQGTTGLNIQLGVSGLELSLAP